MEAHVAGHSTHFLRRLDRVEEDDVELALTLYRDPELLRAVLQAAQLEGDAPRVAIALRPGPADESPHVVVTRDGAFVTCLAKGMTFALPRVPHERLEIAVGRVERMREQVASLRSLIGTERESVRFGRRVNSVGPYLAREEMAAALRWYPLLGGRLFATAEDIWIRFLEDARLVRRRYRNKVRNEDLDVACDQMWKSFWAWLHTFVLAHGGTPEQRQHILAKIVEIGPQFAYDANSFIVISGLRHETLGSSLRGLWAVGRNKQLLKSLKQPSGLGTLGELRRVLGLAGVGVASKKTRGEVDEALRKFPTESFGTSPFWSEHALPLLRLVVADDAAIRAHTLESVAKHAHKAFFRNAAFRERFPNHEDIPHELLLPLYALRADDWLAEPALATILVLLIPLTGRAEGSDFYLPKDVLDLVEPSRSDRALGQLLEALQADIGPLRGETVRHAAPRVGRNAPCPCGSGQKHKRCCARTG